MVAWTVTQRQLHFIYLVNLKTDRWDRWHGTGVAKLREETRHGRSDAVYGPYGAMDHWRKQ